MVKTVKDTYGEILRLRNEFYQKLQDAPQYDENRSTYKAKYEAFDKALELLTPSVVDPQQNEALKVEFNRFLDDMEGVPRMFHSDEQIEWALDIARHFADWQHKQTIEKVCKWLDDNAIDYWGTQAVDNGMMLIDLRKAMDK